MSFIAPLLSVIGSFIGNRGASEASSAAAAGQTALSDTERNLINTLLQQYTGTFQPLEKQVATTFGDITGAMPNVDIARYVVSQLLQPYFNAYQEQAIRQQNLIGLKDAVDEIVSRFGDTMNPEQLQALAESLGERFLTNDVATNISLAGQNIARSRAGESQALQDIANFLGAAGSFSSAGRDLTGQAMGGIQGLIGNFANAARTAAAGYVNPFSTIADIVARYLAAQPRQEAPASPTSNAIPGVTEPNPFILPEQLPDGTLFA